MPLNKETKSIYVYVYVHLSQYDWERYESNYSPSSYG